MTVTAVRLGGRSDHPLLVLGPSLGTSATTLWSAAASHLAEAFQVVAWDLPGHGTNPSRPDPWLTMEKLAGDVLRAVDRVQDVPETGFHYAGDSVGGAVGLQLLIDVPERVLSASLVCTGARIGTAEVWQERTAAVRAAGTGSLVPSAAERWFAPGFLRREPALGSALLDALAAADDAAYVAICEALARFDVRDRLREIRSPVLVIAGECDVPTPPEVGEEIARGVAGAEFVVLPGIGHLAPAEAPEEVARLIRERALGATGRSG